MGGEEGRSSLRQHVPSRAQSTFASQFEEKLTFVQWAAGFLATKTSFTRYLAASFSIVSYQKNLPPTTALSPLPMPSPGCFRQDVPKSLPRDERKALLQERLIDRVLHVSVIALNFLHSNFRHTPASSLRRPPNLEQLRVFGRLRGLLHASSRYSGDLPVCAGRRSANLIARLEELRMYLHECGAPSDTYPGFGASEGFVSHAEGGPPSLQPYRDANAGRLKITGRGHWDITQFLGPEVTATGLPFPDTTKEDRREVRKLFWTLGEGPSPSPVSLGPIKTISGTV